MRSVKGRDRCANAIATSVLTTSTVFRNGRGVIVAAVWLRRRRTAVAKEAELAGVAPANDVGLHVKNEELAQLRAQLARVEGTNRLFKQHPH